MQRALTYRTNRDLFSNHYLDDRLPETEAWQSVDDEEVQEAYQAVSELFEDKSDQVESFNERQLERHLIRPIFNRLGLAWETEESVHGGGRRPHYTFFKDEDDLRRYLEAKERADELDEQIERTDRLIDEIVYELYGLTDEEIAIVEAAVGD